MRNNRLTPEAWHLLKRARDKQDENGKGLFEEELLPQDQNCISILFMRGLLSRGFSGRPYFRPTGAGQQKLKSHRL